MFILLSFVYGPLIEEYEGLLPSTNNFLRLLSMRWFATKRKRMLSSSSCPRGFSSNYHHLLLARRSFLTYLFRSTSDRLTDRRPGRTEIRPAKNFGMKFFWRAVFGVRTEPPKRKRAKRQAMPSSLRHAETDEPRYRTPKSNLLVRTLNLIHS